MAATGAAQVYFTHCLPADSIGAQAGYAARAASTADKSLLQFATEYPAYELPLDMWSSNPSPAEAPRRLALVAAPVGGMALIHSAYLPEDTRGRKNSFFSHYLFVPALAPLDALRTWASPDWAMSYPPGAPKELSSIPLPRPGPLSDQAVSAFLSPTGPSNEQALVTALCPTRLPPDPGKRRELLRRALSGYLLAAQAGDGALRGRLYLLAEPGLAALLLYAIVRLLPEPLTADLTFSTFENAHRTLRMYKSARVVAAYLGNPQKGLDKDYFSTRGYALDTFNDLCSSEILDQVPGLDDLIDLAARGDWATIEETYRLLGPANASVLAFRESREALEGGRRLAAGQAGEEDLVRLHRAPIGRGVLERYRGIVWPMVREGSLTNEALRREFIDWLLDGLADLLARTVEGFRSDLAAGQWRWRLVKGLLADDAARLRQCFVQVVEQLGLGASTHRLPLLREWHSLGDAQLPPPLRALLSALSPAELEGLARSPLPGEWRIEALASALRRPATTATATRLLQEGDDAVLGAVWATARNSKEQFAVLSLLMPASDARSLALLSRVINCGCEVPPKVLDDLLNARGAYTARWDDFWLRQQRLYPLFKMLARYREDAADIWDRFCDRIDQRLIVEQGSAQQALLEQLRRAAEQIGDAVPAGARQAIDDWLLLRRHFAGEGWEEEGHWRSLQDACKRRDLTAEELLKNYFKRSFAEGEVSADALEPFVECFRAFCAPGEETRDHRERLYRWLRIVEDFPPDKQARYQQFYLESCVPLKVRRELVNENVRRLAPEVVDALTRVEEGPDYEVVDEGPGGGAEDEAADLLLTDTTELQAQAVAALRDAPTTEWPERWAELKNALRENIEGLREVFVEIVEAAGGAETGMNLLLLQEWHGLGADELPEALRPLCRGLMIPELKQLASLGLPLAWQAEALTAALRQPESRSAAARLLMDGGEKLFSAFWGPLGARSAREQLQFLGHLMPSSAENLPERLSLLLRSKARVRPEALDAFLSSRGAYEHKWDELWRRDNRLTHLLRTIAPFGEEAAPVWARFCDRLGRGALEGYATQQALFDLLKAVAAEAESAAPAAAREAIRDWALLRQHFKLPPAEGNWREAYLAWKRRGQRPEELFQSYLVQFVLPRRTNASVLESFTEALLGMLPSGDDIAAHKRRLVYWVKIVEACPDRTTQTLFQRYYLEHFVPGNLRRALACDESVLLTAEARQSALGANAAHS
jgi:hypothetical protein